MLPPLFCNFLLQLIWQQNRRSCSSENCLRGGGVAEKEGKKFSGKKTIVADLLLLLHNGRISNRSNNGGKLADAFCMYTH
jgi:hypothetical protein